jgi:hypothetical protein
VLRLLDTGGVKVDAGAGHVDELIDRPAGGPMDAPVPLFNGDTTKPVGGKYAATARPRSFPTSRCRAWSSRPCRSSS